LKKKWGNEFMVKRRITFSADSGEISRKDLDETGRITEKYFRMQNDPNQIPATKKNKDWFFKNALDYLNIIRCGNKIIGYAFLLPCNDILMERFTSGKINEAELFENIKKIKVNDPPDSMYLCASVIEKDFRGKGLATSAFVKTISKVMSNKKERPVLFYWEYSKEGTKLAKRIAKITDLELRKRK
jgi:hypothetical protein